MDLSQDSFRHVKCHGLFGTYADGLEWLGQPEFRDRPCCIMSMGASIGNFNRMEAAQFLKEYARILQPNDMMLIGLDACQNEERVFHAYNDRDGITHEFIRNGLLHANKLLGREVFRKHDWEIVGEYNCTLQCHQAFYKATRDVLVEDVKIRAGEKIRVEESYKYSAAQSRELWEVAGLKPEDSFGNQTDDYREYFSRGFQPIP